MSQKEKLSFQAQRSFRKVCWRSR